MKRYRRQDSPINLAMTIPAVRMLCVAGWWADGAGGHDVLPVVALVAREDDEGGPDFDGVVLDDEAGLMAAAVRFGCHNQAYRLVVADWPRREDPGRLAPIIADVVRCARRNSERSRPVAAARGVAS